MPSKKDKAKKDAPDVRAPAATEKKETEEDKNAVSSLVIRNPLLGDADMWTRQRMAILGQEEVTRLGYPEL